MREPGDHDPGEKPRVIHDEPPPPAGSWARLYTIVIVVLAVEIVLFGLLTRGCG